MKYRNLFSKGKIGNLELKNRIVMPAMGTSFAAFTGEASDEMIRYYEERAKGGCGLIITEIACVDEETGASLYNQLSVTSPKYSKNLKKLVQMVHRHDAKIFLQVQHPGRETRRDLIGGSQVVGPSPIPSPIVRENPRALTVEEIQDLVHKFVSGVVVGKAAGFDGVEVHAAHGYLINQFLSPYANQRADAYGGSLENRMRFLVEIITGIRKACGTSYPVCVRLSVDEFVNKGLKIEDGIQIARKLEELGVDAINVSCGVHESGHTCIEPSSFAEGWKKHLGKAIKENVSIPVIAANNIKHPATAEQLLEEDVCDFVGVARGHLADAQWANKAKYGADRMIRKCIGCLHCLHVLSQGLPLQCTVNPVLGRELIYNDKTMVKNGQCRTAVIVGGGPGGMQAAIVLARRGFKTILFEKSDKLGGTLHLGNKPPYKELLTELTDTMVAELEYLGVCLRLGNEARMEEIQELNPYCVVVAVGGAPVIPDVPGVDLPHVFTAEDVLAGKEIFNKKDIAIIGGGVTGLETAEFLAGGDNRVTVIEMMDEVGISLYTTARLALLDRLQQAGVNILTNCRLTCIAKEYICARDTQNGQKVQEKADAIVLATGVTPRQKLVEAYETAFPCVTVVGDARQAGMIVDAMTDGNDKAFVI